MFRNLEGGLCADRVSVAARLRRDRRLRAFVKHERMTVAMNLASVSHHSFKKPDVMHSAVQTEEYVDPPAPMNVNVAAAPALSIGIADHLEPPVPLIQHIDMILERAPVTKYVTPALVIEVTCVSPSQQFSWYFMDAPVKTCRLHLQALIQQQVQ